MEGEKRKFEIDRRDNEIVYSKAIKAGKRIYYLDVKKSRNNDLYLAITESKKKVNGFDDNAEVSFEKHKIFLYREDFEKFSEGLGDVIGFIRKEQGDDPQRPEYVPFGERAERPQFERAERQKYEQSEPLPDLDGDDNDDDKPEGEGGKTKSFFSFFK